MKKILITTLLLLTSIGAVSAQSWQELLNKIATEATDKATDGKLTQYALIGSWSYAGAAAKFESNDLVAMLGGAALEDAAKKQLDRVYQTVGLKPGIGKVTFTRKGSFEAQLESRKISGTYTFDASTRQIAVKLADGKIDLGSVPGNVYVSGENLILAFPVKNLVEIVKKYGGQISSMESVMALLEQYEGIYIGAELSRVK